MTININLLPSQHAAIVANIDPDAYTADTYTSGWVDMSKFASIMAIILVGDIASNGTVDAKLEQATSSAGAGAKDITGKAITQLTQAGTDSNKQAIINLRNDELDIANSFTHVRLSLTTAVAAADAAGIILGFYPYNGFANDNDVSTVDEIVA